MKIVIFSDDTIYYTSRNDYKVSNPLTRLYAELGKWFDRVIMSGPVNHVHEPVEGYVESRIMYSPRPYYGGSVLGFFKYFPKIMIPTFHNIVGNVKQADLIMLRLPSPIGIWVYWQARRHRKPCFLYTAGDVRRVASQGEKYRNPLIKFVVAVAANMFHWLTKRMAQGALVFVTGSELYQELNPLAQRCINIIPSVVSDSDIFDREDTCLREPIQLLYVGRLVPVKGLRYLFRAMHLLLDKGAQVSLQIVGEGYHRPWLTQIANELDIANQVHFRDRIAFGPKLFGIYRQADIFVLPSLSEGVPKTLLEAMASGLPIVATRVGGIPDIVKDGETGLLVEPRSPEQIAQAIERLSSDTVLRKRIIQTGYEFAREHTVEKQAERMWQEICRFFHLEGK